MAKKVTKIIHIGLYKAQSDVVERIEADGRSLPEIIRAALDQYGEKFYPADAGYVQVAKERLALKKKTVEEQDAWDNLKPEDYARDTLKARTAQGSAWFIIGAGLDGGTDYPVELKEVKNLTEENSRVVKTHLAILNHEFTWDNGLKGLRWTVEACEKRIKAYHQHLDELEAE